MGIISNHSATKLVVIAESAYTDTYNSFVSVEHFDYLLNCSNFSKIKYTYFYNFVV